MRHPLQNQYALLVRPQDTKKILKKDLIEYIGIYNKSLYSFHFDSELKHLKNFVLKVVHESQRKNSTSTTLNITILKMQKK